MTKIDAASGEDSSALQALWPWGVLGAAYGLSMTITPFFYDGLNLEEDMIGKLTGAQGIGVICAGSGRAAWS